MAGVIEVKVEIEVERPAAEVFEYLADFENNPEWQKGMRSARWTSPPPHGAGSTYDQVATFLGKEVLSSFEVVEHVPGYRVTITSRSGSFPITVTRMVTPLGPGRCRVAAIISGDPTGFYRLAGPLLRRMVARSVERDYQSLAAVLQEEPGSALGE